MSRCDIERKRRINGAAPEREKNRVLGAARFRKEQSFIRGGFIFFFFSSRRRHTRLQGDWSSDVCSSDLPDARELRPAGAHPDARRGRKPQCIGRCGRRSLRIGQAACRVKERALLAALFLVTLATVMFEVLLTRVFSVTMWYHFAFMAISMAMFGMTLGALLVFLRPAAWPEETLLPAMG